MVAVLQRLCDRGGHISSSSSFSPAEQFLPPSPLDLRALSLILHAPSPDLDPGGGPSLFQHIRARLSAFRARSRPPTLQLGQRYSNLPSLTVEPSRERTSRRVSPSSAWSTEIRIKSRRSTGDVPVQVCRCHRRRDTLNHAGMSRRQRGRRGSGSMSPKEPSHRTSLRRM